MPPTVPVIDVSPLLDGRDPDVVARAIDEACRTFGFFTIVGHGVDATLLGRVETAARAFFALPEAEKAAIAMHRGGRAWRGWFPLGGELTSGVPDGKEGLYFGAELPADHPRVRAGVPLHGANLFPEAPADLRPAVLAHLDAMTALGHVLMTALARGLGLDADWFGDHLTADPTILFRIFRYPPTPEDGWGVAEHTDYGLLTILHQDDLGGLEVHGRDGWLAVPPVPDALVCNLGDMLERMTAGAYRSTPHRVRNTGTGDRLSLAFFFDPSWDAEVAPLPISGPAPAPRARWDGADPLAFTGTYGEYLLGKVAKVFPDLDAGVAPP